MHGQRGATIFIWDQNAIKGTRGKTLGVEAEALPNFSLTQESKSQGYIRSL